MPVRIQADFRLPDLGYPPIQMAHRQFLEGANEVVYRAPAPAGVEGIWLFKPRRSPLVLRVATLRDFPLG
jgi:hypothetical protein